MGKIKITNAFTFEPAAKASEENTKSGIKIFINEKDYGSIPGNTTKEYELEEGEYELYIKVLWKKGKKIKVKLTDNEIVELNFGTVNSSNKNSNGGLIAKSIGLICVLAFMISKMYVFAIIAIPIFIYGFIFASKNRDESFTLKRVI